MLRGYHGILIPGHPNIGIESLWHMVSPLMVSRLFLMASTLIMNALFWDKLKGSRGHWLLGVYGVVLAVLIDCWLIAGAVAAGKPREGALYACFSVSVIAALVTRISGARSGLRGSRGQSSAFPSTSCRNLGRRRFPHPLCIVRTVSIDHAERQAPSS